MTQPGRSMSSAKKPCGELSQEVLTEEQFAEDLVRFDACDPVHEHDTCSQQQPHSPIPDSRNEAPLSDSSDGPISFFKYYQNMFAKSSSFTCRSQRFYPALV